MVVIWNLGRLAFRRLGIGEKLTEMVGCKYAFQEGAREIRVLVFEDNKPAVNLYQKMGFQRTSLPYLDKKLHFKKKKTGRHRIIMERKLASEDFS